MSVLEDQLRDQIINQYESVPKFAKAIGEPPTSIYGALSRGMKNTRTELTDKIYRGLNIDMNSVNLDDFNRLELLSDVKSSYIDVPLYGSIAAGKPIEMMDIDQTHPAPAQIVDKFPDGFFLKVEGESMNRILPNGCYAYIKPCNEVMHDGKPYAVCVNGYDATIKRVHKLNNGFELVPDSTDITYPIKTYNYNEPGTETITIIGEVVYYVLPFDWSF